MPSGESVSWQQMQWMRFLKNEPYKMFYKTSLDYSLFHVLDLSHKRGRPKIYGNINLYPLYTSTRPITEEKRKDIMSLLQNILAVFWIILRILKTRNDNFLKIIKKVHELFH